MRYEGAEPAVPFIAAFDAEASAGPGVDAEELWDAVDVFFAELVFGRSLGELEGMMLLNRLHRFLPPS